MKDGFKESALRLGVVLYASMVKETGLTYLI